MSTLSLKDLTVNAELDRKAMVSVTGGRRANTFTGVNRNAGLLIDSFDTAQDPQPDATLSDSFAFTVEREFRN